ncbi:LysM peptidoglycan-binding domain-containing protein [Desulforamulus putei]|uniref:LysM domain-containing protein n=1 Tax=Desulforamulus putei DSM 12395 TaxID=1121429 RepID=A0A1M4S979_9FIRM|nr:LysM peptidoglycan-binding domain-containing protein [Desulforamulus putei]SHE28756.1 LysM domain-containing protein [Desulforamulus putei DSM 12395]
MLFNKKTVCSLVISSVLFFNGTAFASTFYTVKKGDSLWVISRTYNTTVEELKRVNRLTSDNLSIGQRLLIPNLAMPSRGGERAHVWLVDQSGRDHPNLQQNIQQLEPEQTKTQSKSVELVNWFTEGKALFKSGEFFSVTDCKTGAKLSLKVLSAGNHCDIEPATSEDTKTIKELFGQWTWSPRPVVIHKDGRNIAGSLSGMPHSIDTTPDNGVTGHFDLYLHNSRPHGSGISERYVQQHYTAISQAAAN